MKINAVPMFVLLLGLAVAIACKDFSAGLPIWIGYLFGDKLQCCT